MIFHDSCEVRHGRERSGILDARFKSPLAARATFADSLIGSHSQVDKDTEEARRSEIALRARDLACNEVRRQLRTRFNS